MIMYADVRVILMAKAPVPGRVKTRLMPHYTAEESAAIYRTMTSTVLDRIRRLFRDIWLAADNPGHPFFSMLSLPIKAQGEGDLGQRMARLMEKSFRKDSKSVLFLGCDSPHMPDARLHQAVSCLRDYDVVIGPVEDGGYDLIALKQCHPAIFAGVPWSTGEVLEKTRRQARALALRYMELDMGFDIDTAEDLSRSGFLENYPTLLSP